MNTDMQVTDDLSGTRAKILSIDALYFLKALHEKFDYERQSLLQRRADVAAQLRHGLKLAPPAETEWIRISDWRVPPAPWDLRNRRVEVSGAADSKAMSKTFSAGANVYVADLERAVSQSWEDTLNAQFEMREAVERRADATLVVRPRGWHLAEPHVLIGGRPVSASLFDFGIFFFHSARSLHARGTGPLLYLSKLESRFEARLWNDVFVFAESYFGVPRGSVRASVLIDTCFATFEMEEMLHELREHAAGLTATRVSSLFNRRGYVSSLLEICHRRGAHAISALPEDVRHESGDGFDGILVSHPDLVLGAMDFFDKKKGGRPDLKSVRPLCPAPRPDEFLPSPVEGVALA